MFDIGFEYSYVFAIVNGETADDKSAEYSGWTFQKIDDVRSQIVR